MEQISCRYHGEVRVDRPRHYKNFSVRTVDGQKRLVETEPVNAGLASEFSVVINAVTRPGNNSLKKRMNVDAVDVESTIKNLM